MRACVINIPLLSWSWMVMPTWKCTNVYICTVQLSYTVKDRLHQLRSQRSRGHRHVRDRLIPFRT